MKNQQGWANGPALNKQQIMQTALKQLIEQLRISGNIHGVMEAEKFLPIEKEMIKNAYWNGTVDLSKNDALEFAEEFFNDYYN